MFILKLGDEARLDAMLGEVAASVLRHLGYADDASREVVGTLRDQLSRGIAQDPQKCDVQFRTEAGQLLIVVSFAGGREWRATRALPRAD